MPWPAASILLSVARKGEKPNVLQFVLRGVAALVIIGVASPSFSSSARAEGTLVVTTTADLASCSVGTLSLRCALEDANATTGGTTIAFHIPSSDTGCHGPVPTCTIEPSAALPPITAPSVVVDGYSQPGSVTNRDSASQGDHAVLAVQLLGDKAGQANGLEVRGEGDIVQGLAIRHFSGSGIMVSGGAGAHDILRGLWVGIAPDGVTADGNAGGGVVIENDAGTDTVGGASPADADIISGNGRGGVLITGGGQDTILGNDIGTNAAGAAALPNQGSGITISGSADNTIGSAGAGNVVSGNTADGLSLFGTSGNTVSGNLIGTTASGLARLPNGGEGIALSQTSKNTIGGAQAGAGNLISGNGLDGIAIRESGGNIVTGNSIGTDRTGMAAIGNGADGILLEAESSNQIGGPGTAGNLISGNGARGIVISNGGSNRIQGNKIGTNATGTAGLPNVGDGLYLESASHDLIGGSDNGVGNLIEGNGRDGIEMVLSINETISGNQIGSSNSGGIGNRQNGIYAHSSTSAVLVTLNSIAHNGAAGVVVGSSHRDATYVAIMRNVMFGNHGPGIYLAALGGVKCNVKSAAPNAPLPCPVITRAKPMEVQGRARPGSVVEVFVARSNAADHGHGQGARFLGSTKVTDSSGHWRLKLTRGQLRKGRHVTATATWPTDPESTSAFSRNRVVR